MITKYFDSKRDAALPCFCQACLVGKEKTEMSRDPRYCKVCCDSLLGEAQLIRDGRKHEWIPQPTGNAPQPKFEDKTTVPTNPLNTGGETKMLTLNEKPVIVNNLGARGRKKTYRKKELPEALIKQLYNEGMGSKAIASRLKREQGIEVSFMTVSRVLTGERTC